jgi:acyl carrier protein
VRGELHIGGAGLARGYLNRPALTAEWFVPDPFSGQAGARLYRTGDLARFQRDGTIEFLGRTDHQVKIRGFRIELGEIEHALSQHPAVREAVVVARHGDGPDDPEDLRLVAYLVCAADPPSASELRAHLRRTLPGYMIPAIFVHLDALPLNASGKVDRRALPPPGTSRPTLGEPYVPPRGPVEKQLADIWAELLGVQGIGVYDDFFELGGNSLLGTRVITRLHEVLGVDIPLKLLFQEPTLAALAAAIPGMPGLAAADAAAIPRLPRRPVHQPQPPGPGNRAAAEPAVQDRPGPGSAPC